MGGARVVVVVRVGGGVWGWGGWGVGEVSLAGAATSIIFVATKARV